MSLAPFCGALLLESVERTWCRGQSEYLFKHSTNKLNSQLSTLNYALSFYYHIKRSGGFHA